MGDVSRARLNRRGRGLCLPVAATSMGRLGVARDSSAMLVLPVRRLKGAAADLLAPSYSPTRELPSGATLCPDEADVALARATGL